MAEKLAQSENLSIIAGVDFSNPTPLERAIAAAGGMTALARRLTEHGHDVKDHRTVYQWGKTRVPADYCPDIEAITGVRCEDLRPDVNWGVLRNQKAKET